MRVTKGLNPIHGHSRLEIYKYIDEVVAKSLYTLLLRQTLGHCETFIALGIIALPRTINRSEQSL